MKKLREIYRGKAKSLYETDDPNQLIMLFRDDATAFNGVKKAQLERKGRVNNQFSAFILGKLSEAGIPTHYEKMLSANEAIVKRLTMIPVECVVRNIAAGSICKRLGINEGIDLDPAIFEFFYKNDELGDPIINESHILTFGWATKTEIQQMQELTLKINSILTKIFSAAGLLLVDYKIEFGRFKGQLTLGDEFTPDGCRLWDDKTRKKLDKDRFRQDLGSVIEAYEEVAQRLGLVID